VTARRIVIGLLACCMMPVAAEAAQIELSDGTVVIGSILRLEDGVDLVVDTAFMGEVVIEWDAIKRIENTKPLQIELFDGQRLLGTFTRDGQTLELVGEASAEIEASRVFEIEEYNATVWEGFSGDTSLGMNIVRGNNQVTQIAFGTGIEYEDHSYEAFLRANTIVNEQVEAGDTRRTTLNGAYTHKYDGGWQAFGRLQFEADEQQTLMDARCWLVALAGES